MNLNSKIYLSVIRCKDLQRITGTGTGKTDDINAYAKVSDEEPKVTK